MLQNQEWESFKGRLWKEECNVRDFIQNNFTQYNGDESFLVGPTDATNKLWDKLQALQKAERENGGVLKEDADVVSSITAYGPGYIDPETKDLEQVVGLQNALTGDVDQATPGLLNKSENGGSDSGGKIFMTFNVDSIDAYQCGNGTSNTIGNFTLCINISNTDTEQDILDKLNDIFDSSYTLFDLNNINKCANNVYSSTVNTALIAVNKIDLVKDEKKWI